MSKNRNLEWFVDELLWLFRDMEASEINEIMEVFRKNDELRMDGYGWKRVKVKCFSLGCEWKGRRVWGENMFKKLCPRCGERYKSGKTTIDCPNTCTY
ncbi:MAG: hypothetical protein D4Q79_01610 [Spirochaetia bacterium]|nr:MAG: hypothetical protein D4Q79_01610 [Spirochaetia bacterium]